MKFRLLLLLLMSFQVFAENIELNWEVGYSDSKDLKPKDYYSSNVPGAVQLDYINAQKDKNFWFGDNYTKYKFLETKFWHYKASFKKPEISNNQHVYFISEGIDYEFEILINNQNIFHQEGMFSPVNLILDEFLQEKNVLEIIIYPIPIEPNQPEGRRQAINSVKPPVSYGWDWHPRLIPSGIWNTIDIVVASSTLISDDHFDYSLSDNYSTASLKYDIQISDLFDNITFVWVLSDANGSTVYKDKGIVSSKNISVQTILKNINLWWPHDQGHPHLYTSTFSIYDFQNRILDKKSKKIGFREIKLVMNEGTWNEPDDFPKSRSKPPFTIQINGRKIFAKGSNWVHPEIFYGTINHKRYLEQIMLAKEANFNLLRVWGGGIVNKKSFFNICDSLGILVWQEFPLACNPYTDDADYIKILEQEAISIIKSVREHPCLAFWSGGNELFNSWSGMTDQSLPLRLLNSLCFQLDPKTPFIMTSPLMGVGHGHYIFYDDNTDEDVFQLMKRARNTALTEFGMPGVSSFEVLKEIIPDVEMFPPMENSSWEHHHAFKVWRNTSWLELPILEKYLGKASSIEELIHQSQFLQSVGYKAIYEGARRLKPYCSMAVNWCFNEPWPTAANNSLINYPNIPKPAFFAVKESCRPVLASAAFRKFDWLPGEELEIECWILNDSHVGIPPGKIDVFLTINNDRKKIGTWDYPALDENKNFRGPTYYYKVPSNTSRQTIKIELNDNENTDFDSYYFLLINSRRQQVLPLNRLNYGP